MLDAPARMSARNAGLRALAVSQSIFPFTPDCVVRRACQDARRQKVALMQFPVLMLLVCDEVLFLELLGGPCERIGEVRAVQCGDNYIVGAL